jgi:hypothetical protein
VQHLIKCLENRKGVNMAKSYQHANGFKQFENCIRVKRVMVISATGVPMLLLLRSSGAAIAPVLSLLDTVTF